MNFIYYSDFKVIINIFPSQSLKMFKAMSSILVYGSNVGRWNNPPKHTLHRKTDRIQSVYRKQFLIPPKVYLIIPLYGTTPSVSGGNVRAEAPSQKDDWHESN